MVRRSTFALGLVLALAVVACTPAKPIADPADDPSEATGIVGVWENVHWGQEICFFFCDSGKAFMVLPTCNDREDAVEYDYVLDGADMTMSQKGEVVFNPTIEFIDDDTIDFDLVKGTPTRLERGDHAMVLCGG